MKYAEMLQDVAYIWEIFQHYVLFSECGADVLKNDRILESVPISFKLWPNVDRCFSNFASWVFLLLFIFSH